VIRIIKEWFNRYFSDPEAVLLFFILVIGFGLIMTLGGILAPVLASLVIAYLLEWVVTRLQSLKIPRMPAVWIAFLGFLGLFFVSLFVLLPLLWKQLATLFNNLPSMLLKAQHMLSVLVVRFPEFFSQEQIDTFTSELLTESRNWAKVVLSISWSSITGIITWLVYLVLVPLLVFFFLKDRQEIIHWGSGYLPHKRGILRKVSSEVNQQIGNYIRGKVVEIIVVGFATYAVFWFFNMQYGVLLASLVGVSVLIPYVGAIVITIPVVLVAYMQWGWGSEFGYLIATYLIVQGLDSNILVPLLFSEAVNLHPIAIVVAILFFGGVWGFWGVFFAIPLATLVKAVLHAWPRHGRAHPHPA
jgi:putative permease